METDKNIFDWLAGVRERPGMYGQTISELNNMVYGYYAALSLHGITECGPRMDNHFLIWLSERTRWPQTNCGWGCAFDMNMPEDRDRFEFFFEFVDNYRLLKPTVMATMMLAPHHSPTGKRCKIGFDGLMDRPDEIIAVNYAPTQLNHLRYRYGKRYVDEWFLMLGNGSHETSLDDLIEWVADEFNAAQSEWDILS